MNEGCDAHPHGLPGWVPLELEGWWASHTLPVYPPSPVFPWFPDNPAETMNLDWYPHGQHSDHVQSSDHTEWTNNGTGNWKLSEAINRSKGDMAALEQIMKGDLEWSSTQPMKVAVPPWRKQGIPDADESKPERDELKPVAEQGIPDADESKPERDKIKPVAEKTIPDAEPERDKSNPVAESKPVAESTTESKPVADDDTTHDEDAMHIDELRHFHSEDTSGTFWDSETQKWTNVIYGNQRRGSGKKRPSGRYGQRGGMKNPNVQWHGMRAQAEREGWLPQFRQMFPHRSAMSSGSNSFQLGVSAQH